MVCEVPRTSILLFQGFGVFYSDEFSILDICPAHPHIHKVSIHPLQMLPLNQPMLPGMFKTMLYCLHAYYESKLHITIRFSCNKKIGGCKSMN